jgi:hypothetical protein
MNTEILNLLYDLAKAGEKVHLYNTYKGVPITFDAEFIKIARGIITLRVHKYQALCIKKTGQTILRHDLLPNPVQGLAVKVDFVELLVMVHDFQYIAASAGNRQMMRVEPERAFTVVLSNGAVVNATAIDISEGGFGVFVKSLFFTDRNFGLEKTVNMEFRFPQERRLVGKMSGVVVNVHPDLNEERFRVGIHSYPDNDAKKLINDYVTQRQADIIQELDTLHRLVQRSKS